MQLGVVAFVAGLTDKTAQTQEEHGVPSNKHYEIPFERGYAVLFPLPESVNDRHRLHSITSDVVLHP